MPCLSSLNVCRWQSVCVYLEFFRKTTCGIQKQQIESENELEEKLKLGEEGEARRIN